MYDEKMDHKYEIYTVFNMWKSAACAVSVLRSLIVSFLQCRLDNDLQISMLREQWDY